MRRSNELLKLPAAEAVRYLAQEGFSSLQELLHLSRNRHGPDYFRLLAFRMSEIRSLMQVHQELLGFRWKRRPQKVLAQCRRSLQGVMRVERALRLAEMLAARRETLPDFADVGFPGYTMTGAALMDLVEEVASRPLKRVGLPWFALNLIGVFSPLMREVDEMRYLWDTPHHLDAAAFDRLVPGFRHTPVDVALASAIPAQLVQQQIDPDQPVAAGGKGDVVA